jgi:hypothetical protein
MDTQMEFPDVDRRILIIRGQSVMLDRDLARIYGVSTKQLNQQVRRNRERFPEDFMFQLTEKEADTMRSQIVTASRRNVRHRPYAFTEHGAMMLANVLKSPVAIPASIQIVRAFNRMRRMIASNLTLAAKLAEIELKLESHDTEIHKLFKTIRRFLAPPPEPPRRIGFKP